MKLIALFNWGGLVVVVHGDGESIHQNPLERMIWNMGFNASLLIMRFNYQTWFICLQPKSTNSCLISS